MTPFFLPVEVLAAFDSYRFLFAVHPLVREVFPESKTNLPFERHKHLRRKRINSLFKSASSFAEVLGITLSSSTNLLNVLLLKRVVFGVANKQKKHNIS